MALPRRHLGGVVPGILLVSLVLRFAPLTIGGLVPVNTVTPTWVIEGWHVGGSGSFTPAANLQSL